MHFGHKLSIGIGLFVVFMITLVVLCFQKKDMYLVSNDYYNKEIAYQQEIDKQNNLGLLSAPVKITSSRNEVVVQFPEEVKKAKGVLLFYRPSNATLDFKVPLSLDANQSQTVNVEKQVGGLWVLKMEWESEGISYMKEENLVL